MKILFINGNGTLLLLLALQLSLFAQSKKPCPYDAETVRSAFATIQDLMPLVDYYVEYHSDVLVLIQVWKEYGGPNLIDKREYQQLQNTDILHKNLLPAAALLAQNPKLEMESQYPDLVQNRWTISDLLIKMKPLLDSGNRYFQTKKYEKDTMRYGKWLDSKLDSMFSEFELLSKKMGEELQSRQRTATNRISENLRCKKTKETQSLLITTLMAAENLCLASAFQKSGNRPTDSISIDFNELSWIFSRQVDSIENWVLASKYKNDPSLQKLISVFQQVRTAISGLQLELEGQKTFFEHNESRFHFDIYKMKPPKESIAKAYKSMIQQFNPSSFNKYD